MKDIIIRTLVAIGLLAFASAHLTAAEQPVSSLKIVSIDYAKVLGAYGDLAEFTKQVESDVAKLREAIALKSTAREALVKQANELAAKRPKEQSDDEFRAQVQPLISAIESVEKEMRELQASPELNKKVADTSEAFRVKIREAVESEVAARGADIVLDLSSVNAAGLPVAVSAKSSRLVDISDAVLARLNPKVEAKVEEAK